MSCPGAWLAPGCCSWTPVAAMSNISLSVIPQSDSSWALARGRPTSLILGSHQADGATGRACSAACPCPDGRGGGLQLVSAQSLQTPQPFAHSSSVCCPQGRRLPPLSSPRLQSPGRQAQCVVRSAQPGPAAWGGLALLLPGDTHTTFLPQFSYPYGAHLIAWP